MQYDVLNTEDLHTKKGDGHWGGGSENTCTVPAAPCKDTCDSDAEGGEKIK